MPNSVAKPDKGENRPNVTVRYLVVRKVEGNRSTVVEPEAFIGLDRARLAAFSHALDGSIQKQGLTGRVTLERIQYASGKGIGRALVDPIDERLAFRVLNDMRLSTPIA